MGGGVVGPPPLGGGASAEEPPLPQALMSTRQAAPSARNEILFTYDTPTSDTSEMWRIIRASAPPLQSGFVRIPSGSHSIRFMSYRKEISGAKGGAPSSL